MTCSSCRSPPEEESHPKWKESCPGVKECHGKEGTDDCRKKEN